MNPNTGKDVGQYIIENAQKKYKKKIIQKMGLKPQVKTRQNKTKYWLQIRFQFFQLLGSKLDFNLVSMPHKFW